MNMISIKSLSKDLNWSVILNGSGFSIKDDNSGEKLFEGVGSNGLYYVNKSCNNDRALFASSNSASLNSSTTYNQIWHKRHASSSVLNELLTSNSIKSKKYVFKCVDCALNKMKKKPFVSRTEYSLIPLELIHIDIWGPTPTPSIYGHKYYLLIMNEYSRYSWFYSLIVKSQVFYCFRKFQVMIEKTTRLPIKSI